MLVTNGKSKGPIPGEELFQFNSMEGTLREYNQGRNGYYRAHIERS